MLGFIAFLAAGLAGCEDPADPLLRRTFAANSGDERSLRHADIAVGAPVSGEERNASEAIARSLAIALRDPAIRQEIKSALAASAVREGKLHLASFLEGRGARIIAAAELHGGLDLAGFERSIASVRNLEFYMPVQDHRARWKGGEDVLVATSLLPEEEGPIAFSPDGHRQVLSRLHPPVAPVLALVPVETDFRVQTPLNLRGSAESACTPAAQATLEESMQLCRGAALARDEGSSRGAVSMSLETQFPDLDGIYATFFRLVRPISGADCFGDCWAMGDPEFEVHALAKDTATGKRVSWQCIGEKADTAAGQNGIRSPEYVYNQDNNFWYSPTEKGVLLLSTKQIDQVQQVDSTWLLMIVEDDDEACTIKTERDPWNLFASVAYAGISYLAFVSKPHMYDKDYIFPSWMAVMAVAAYIKYEYGFDDLIGVLVDKDSTQYRDSYPNNTHVILKGGELKGRATMLLRYSTDVAPAVGPVESVTVWHDSLEAPISATLSLSAAGYDSAGLYVRDRPISWASTNTAVATVSATGQVHTLAAGFTYISATIDGFRDSAKVIVYEIGAPVILVVSPQSEQIDTGATIQLSGRAYDANNRELPVHPSNWWTSNDSIATVSSNGLVSGHRNGTVYVYAEFDNLLDSSAVKVQSLISTVVGPKLITYQSPCVWRAETEGGVSPYSYMWEVNYAPTGDGSTPQTEEFYHDSGGEPFNLSVNVQDTRGTLLWIDFGTVEYDANGSCEQPLK